MAMRLSSSGRRPEGRPLPTGFRSIRDILDGNVKTNGLTNIMGVVKDMQSPMPTQRSDWKCRLKIYDKSTEETDDLVAVNIFRPKEQMPEPVAGDVFIAFSIKVQHYNGEISLISHHTTSIHVYSKDQIPRPPESAKSAVKPIEGQRGKAPGESENLYVSWFYHNVDKATLPTEAEYQEQVQRSANIKEKFSLLQDIREGGFYDLIVRVVQTPYDSIHVLTLWVTDYTENDRFFQHKLNPSGLDGGVDGDPYGYTAKHRIPTANSWPGPFGKRSLQMTCYEPHATFMRTVEVKTGDWIKLRNVQVKYGRNGNNLEGFLRGDQRYPDRIGVEVLETSEQKDDSVDRSRLKAAIRRHYDYDKAAKKQLKELAASRRDNGAKRKPEATLNSKQRRKLKRSRVDKEEKEQEEHRAKMLGLNDLVKCESESQEPFPLSRILEGTEAKLRCGGDEAQSALLPFDNVKFRANVRVVDFCPRKLEDFATWRRESEFDLLSDHGLSSGPESDTDHDEGTLDRFAGQKVWEWRFALELEEVDPKRKKNEKAPRIWALVNNVEAQQLVRLDAVDLRAHPEDVALLRERLFVLWGNLEECKRHEAERNLRAAKRVDAREAPPHSSDDEAANTRLGARQPPAKVSNMPFTCCLRQYGVKVPESDARMCDAGRGSRYQRLFGLFGTTISSA